MNQQEKIVQAIDRLSKAQEDHRQALLAVKNINQELTNATAELCRVLHAVLGERAQDGVIAGARRYRVNRDGLLEVTEERALIIER